MYDKKEEEKEEEEEKREPIVVSNLQNQFAIGFKL